MNDKWKICFGGQTGMSVLPTAADYPFRLSTCKAAKARHK